MMKRFLYLFSVVVFLLGLSGVGNAATINYLYLANGNEMTSPYYATVENFNLTPSWTWAGSYELVTGSVSGKYAAPAGVSGVADASRYVTVPKSDDPDSSGSVMVTGLPDSNYFGIWWGSMDTYNTFTFYYNGAFVQSFTGTDVAVGNIANGNQVAPSTNHYVNFLGLNTFNSFQMSSTQFAFEADNIAIGYNPKLVPEAGSTLLLLSFGIGAASLMAKRWKK